MNKKQIIKEIQNEINETKAACYNLTDCYLEGHREAADVIHYLDVNRSIIYTLEELLEKIKE